MELHQLRILLKAQRKLRCAALLCAVLPWHEKTLCFADTPLNAALLPSQVSQSQGIANQAVVNERQSVKQQKVRTDQKQNQAD